MYSRLPENIKKEKKEKTTQCDTSKPITPNILHERISLHTTNIYTYFIRVVHKTMYLLAYYAMLRVGKFTSSSKQAQFYMLKLIHKGK